MTQNDDSLLTYRTWIDALKALTDEELAAMQTHTASVRDDLGKLMRPLSHKDVENFRIEYESHLTIMSQFIRAAQIEKLQNKS